MWAVRGMATEDGVGHEILEEGVVFAQFRLHPVDEPVLGCAPCSLADCIRAHMGSDSTKRPAQIARRIRWLPSSCFRGSRELTTRASGRWVRNTGLGGHSPGLLRWT